MFRFRKLSISLLIVLLTIICQTKSQTYNADAYTDYTRGSYKDEPYVHTREGYLSEESVDTRGSYKDEPYVHTREGYLSEESVDTRGNYKDEPFVNTREGYLSEESVDTRGNYKDEPFVNARDGYQYESYVDTRDGFLDEESVNTRGGYPYEPYVYTREGYLDEPYVDRSDGEIVTLPTPHIDTPLPIPEISPLANNPPIDKPQKTPSSVVNKPIERNDISVLSPFIFGAKQLWGIVKTILVKMLV